MRNISFLSFKGRMSRRNFWASFVLLILAAIIFEAVLPLHLFIANVSLAEAQENPFVVLTPLRVFEMAIFLWFATMFGVKRCHDRDRPGWYLLIWFVPLIGQIWLSIELAFFRGTSGPNRYGPDPLSS
jgi:uncharacterized membrane protein YhaH (DUF805 family)